MTQHVLIGVGGSGQHVVHAYLRLLTLTSPKPQSVPHVFIVDADASHGAGAAKKSFLIDDIFELHRFLVTGDQVPARCEVLAPYRVLSTGKAASPVLGQLIGVTDNDALAHGFLSNDAQQWDNDWTIELSKGMMANPKVGSIALAHKMEALGDEGSSIASGESQQFGNLFSVLRDGVRVAVVGSNFGGTGSGVIPVLVRRLDTRPGIESVRAFMSLPWFSIEGDDSASSTSAARARDDLDPRMRNSSLGLHTYIDDISGGGGRLGRPLQKSTYVLCQSKSSWPEAKRIDDGNFDQRENRHVLNLVQANAIQVFFGLGAATAPPGTPYCIKTHAETEEISGVFDASRSPHLRFWAGPGDSRQLSDMVADAEATAFVLEKSGRMLSAAKDGALRLVAGEQMSEQPGIDRFMINLSAGLEQPTVRHGYFFKRRETASPEVFVQLGTAMTNLATQIRHSLVWLDGHATARAGADAGSLTGVTGYSTSHLFRPAQFGDSRRGLANVDNNTLLVEPWKALGIDVKVFGDVSADAEVINQANAIFVDLFAKKSGADAVEALIAEFEEARRISQTASLPAVAARVIGQAAHQRVFAARILVRRTEDAADARQRDPQTEGNAGKAMLSFVGPIATPIEDARLARLERLNPGEAVIGNVRVDPFSTVHPLSLTYIDPYGGLTVENGSRVSFAQHRFAEHGLRGIPNITAPHLLQKWRMEKCRPQTVEDRQGGYYTEREGRVRATKAGVFLHARRVNEAALWLIASADPRVAFVNDLFDATDSGALFAKLLRKELRMAATETLQALVFANDSEHAGKPVFLWSGETWYLAANTAARDFFASLIAELPTVRYSYRADNPLVRLSAPNVSASKALDTFFALQLSEAIAALDAFASTDISKSTEPAALLREVLSEVRDELPPPSAKPGAGHRGAATALWLKSARNPGAQLLIAPHRMVSELQSFFCRPAVVFVDRDLGFNGLLPVRAEAWQLLEGGRDDNRLVLAATPSKKLDERSLAVRRVEQMRLKVAGLGVLEQSFPFGRAPLPQVQEELAWSFGIWPNFRAENWNYYVISGSARLGDPEITDASRKAFAKRINVDWLREGMKVALVVKGRRRGAEQGGPLRELGRVTDGLPRRIDGAPEVLELEVDGKVLGSRRIELRTVQGMKSIQMLGIDFGTSNTCVAMQANESEGRDTVPLLPGGAFKGSGAAPMLHYIDSGEENAQRTFLTRTAAFFHVKNATVVGGPGDTLPSELLVSLDDTVEVARKQKDMLLTLYGVADRPDNSPGELPLPLDDYPLVSPLLTPLPPSPHGLDTDQDFFAWLQGMVRSNDLRLYGDLKWPRGSDDLAIRVSRDLRALYLEHSIVAALAVVRSHGYASFREFVATQPEALSQVRNNFADSFRDDIATVVQGLSDRTGMRWGDPSANMRTSSVILISETVAALHMELLNKENSPVSVLTIDMGGGTTDVGVRLRYGSSGSAQRRYTASARFAGNKLLEALAQAAEVGNYFARNAVHTETAYSVDALKSLLKSELRRGPVHGGLRSEQTARIAEMYFDAVYEYAFKVLSAFIEVNPGWVDQFVADDNQRLTVALLGNGFKLYEAFQEPGSRRTFDNYNAAIRKRLVKAGLLPQAVENKLEFRLPEATKSGLILSGGLNAALSGDFFKDDERLILLSKGVSSRADDGSDLRLNEPRLMPLADFGRDWLGYRNDRESRRRISFDTSIASLRQQFPLTIDYWTSGRKERRNDLQNIFAEGARFAPLYVDVGALYLTGVPLHVGRSFAWLLAEYAMER